MNRGQTAPGVRARLLLEDGTEAPQPMTGKFLGFVVVAAAGLGAAGAGAFLALRQPPAAAPAQVAAAASPATGAVTRAVDETEARVNPEGVASAAPHQVAGKAPASRGRTAAPVFREPSVERRPPARVVPPVERAEPAARPGTIAESPAPVPAEPVESARVAIVPAPVAEPPPPPAPPEPQYEELIIPADAVIGLEFATSVSSDTAEVEDRVEALVTRDVRVAGRVAIPAGSRAEGVVTLVEEGGKFKERARLGVRFHTVVLADGSRVPLATETVYREGAAPGNKSAAKIGGAAIGGAVLGAIFGGGKGAAIGGSIGAAGGTAAVMAGDRKTATLPAGTTVTVRLSGPATVTVER